VAQEQNGRFAARQVAVTLGDTVGNNYSISSGLNAGDRVIVSSTQYLVSGMPVMPMGG
jgi:multidrug efflux pump subunit AcrA (membrane-fusion protein)